MAIDPLDPADILPALAAGVTASDPHPLLLDAIFDKINEHLAATDDLIAAGGYMVVQTAAGQPVAARPADAPNGFVTWRLFDAPDGSEGIQSLDVVENISGTAWA